MMVTKASVQRFTNTLDIETIRAVKWVHYFEMRRIHPRRGLMRENGGVEKHDVPQDQTNTPQGSGPDDAAPALP